MSEPLNVKHKIGDTCRKVYSYFKPISNSSSFVKNGTLTPEEFVDAGDFLVYKFKTWEWQEADINRTVPYLPEKKQFLITKNAPCKHRIKDLNYIIRDLEVVENEWLFPHYEEDNNATDIGDFVHDLNFSESAPLKEERVHADSDDDDVIDINNFDINCDVIKEDDPAALDSAGYYSKNAENENVMKIRTYDVSITYDKYYETPRIWLFGYDENGSPLKSDKIFEDILADYSNKTYDPHPCTGVMTASIHPCRHAEAMLRIVKNWVTEEKEPRHDLYLLFLLKFISGVIPTIEYDFTTDIELPRIFLRYLN
ncbi:autophagy-related protein 3 [Plasmodium brasilianum]|uniref:Autophagy-related protein 3 n=2 Tax=Plasmodium (Plasmodium) TaxID=418103 RepID=A0ACB9YDA3_PLABR|nr:autophagy-related protein 3 [Plasmodium brasilianum]SBS83586.1 autophagy-related protein 3, putative (ATG3) [Plasmodium malariae]